jgi:thymidylate kinase
MATYSFRTPLKIAVTGPDGSGKSTTCRMLVEALKKELSPDAVREVAIWDALGSSAFPDKAAVMRHAGELVGAARTLFIFQLYAQAMAQAEASGAPVLVCNGHWFKYAVSELGYGVPPAAVFGAARVFAPVDLTFYLALDPIEAWRRRRRASVYEQGLIAGSAANTELKHDTSWLSEEERFIVFQRHLGRHWQKMARDFGPWVQLGPSYTREARAETILAHSLALYRGSSRGYATPA